AGRAGMGRGGRGSGVCALAVVVVGGLSATQAPFSRPLVPLDSTRAHLIWVTSADAHYGEVLRYVRAHTEKADVIYSGAADHSRLLVNDSLLYFLTERVAAGRFLEVDPGLVNAVAGQLELVEARQAERVPLVVLLAIPFTEPNLTDSSNGVHELDDFITAHYAKRAAFGEERGVRYTILQ